MTDKFQTFGQGAALVVLVCRYLRIPGSPSALTFTLHVIGACGISAPAISSATGISEAGAQQCNNLPSGTTGSLLGSRNVAFGHDASVGGIQSFVGAITSTTSIPSISNTSATDTLSFSGGPSEFELLVTLDYATEVKSTLSAATFVDFDLGVQRLGGSGGIASDNFSIADYATATSQERFDDDPIRILINNDARLNLSAALTAQATSGSLAGQNDNDEAFAQGAFLWSIFVPEGVRITSTSGFGYNQVVEMTPVPLPAVGLLLLSAIGLILVRPRRQE